MNRTEAIEVIRKCWPVNRNGMLCDALETLIPELRESEDKKIRKSLLFLCDEWEKERMTIPVKEDVKEIRVWLEKQEEQKPVQTEEEREYVKTLKGLVSDFVRDLGGDISDFDYYQRICNWLDGRHIEQKPAEKEITLTNFEETLNTFLFEFTNSSIEDCEPKEYIKKHSAEILKAAYKELNAQLQQDIFEAKQEGRQEGYEAARAEASRKSVQKKQKPVKKQDYSGLNDFERAILRGFLAAGLENVPVTIIKETAEDCLANMKPAGWKPLPESMEALLLAIEGKWDAIKPTGYMSRRLEDLYDGLVNTFDVDEKYLSNLPKTEYTEKDIEEIKALKEKIDSSMETKPAEWSEEDEKKIHFLSRLIEFQVKNDEYIFGDGSMVSKQEAVEMLKSLRPQPQQNMSISFMLYLDEIRPEGKMCLSNGECNDIEDAFKKQDWPRLFKYINKYQPHWKPSEEQMEALKNSAYGTYQNGDGPALRELYEQLKKL